MLEDVEGHVDRALGHVSRELEIVMAQVTLERVAVLEAIRQERLETIDTLREEREVVMGDLEGIADTMVAASFARVEATIDYFFYRLVQFTVGLMIVIALGLVALRLLIFRPAG